MLFRRAVRFESRTKKKKAVDPAAIVRLRLRTMRVVVFLMFGLLLAQLWNLQVVKGDEYRQRAENNRLRVVQVPPTRGVIYDRNGVQLVSNVPSFSAAVVPGALPRSSDDVYARLSALIHVPADRLKQTVDERAATQDRFDPVVVKRDLDRDTALLLEEQRLQLPGVVVLTQPQRQYIDEPPMAHVLGYTFRLFSDEYEQLKDQGYKADDVIGKAGIEAHYEQYLRGEPGWEIIEVDASERKIRAIASAPAQPGENVVLTIDKDLQHYVAEVLDRGKGSSRYAAAVVLEPNTGEVLALVSIPSYDPNLFSGDVSDEDLESVLNDERRPLVNYAITAQHPPGSTFKLITGAAALQEGLVVPTTKIESKGFITVQNEFDRRITYRFNDHSVLGLLDFYRGLAMSSDVYYYYLAGGYQSTNPRERFEGLGVDRLARYARMFGLGERTGIDLANEARGLVPDPEWKKRAKKEDWYLGDTYNMGIGQGDVQTTPLQMAVATAAFANDGRVLQPHVVREVRDVQGQIVQSFGARPINPELPRVPIDPVHLATINEGMRQSVVDGVATNGHVAGISIAGKTGTAEYGEIDPKTGKYKTTHGWYVAFAPMDRPKVVVCVFAESGGGNDTAAPIGAKIIEYVLTHGDTAAARRVQAALQGQPSG